MRIFGRKANQQSASPSQPDVPLELQPYYGRPSLGTRLRRIGMFVLPVVAALALVAALIAGSLWLKNRSDHNKVATNQSTQQPATNNNQRSGGSKNSTTQNQLAAPAPSSGSAGSSAGSGGTTSQPALGAVPSTDTNKQETQSSIPNTGPDPSMYVVALAAAVTGTAVAYVRQLKADRR